MAVLLAQPTRALGHRDLGLLVLSLNPGVIQQTTISRALLADYRISGRDTLSQMYILSHWNRSQNPSLIATTLVPLQTRMPLKRG